MELDLIEKNEDVVLAYGLSHSEFRCKCKRKECTFTLVNHRLVNAYEIVRTTWGTPLIISSGFRCQMHNKKVGGTKASRHSRGSAIDISPVDRDLKELYDLAVKFFDVVIPYWEEGFLHCHMEAL